MNPAFQRMFLAMAATVFVAACSHSPSKRPLKTAARISLPEQWSTPEVQRRNFPVFHDRSFAFERPAGLETQVAFWRNVYSVWSLTDMVIHDNRYLDVVYEVVSRPGDVDESFSSEEKGWVSERRDYWKFRLHDLQGKLSAGQNLTAEDRELLEKLGSPQRVAGAADRIRIQRGMRERFKRGLEISSRYDRKFREIFRSQGLPEDLAYLPHVESSFQAAARSSAGAVGIWQFTRAAAERYMTVNDRVDERLDPVASARGAARYLSEAYTRLGNWPMAVTSYNHGLGGMQRAHRLYGDDFMRMVEEYDHPLFGFASRNFYAEFLAARDIARDPERYFAERVRYERPRDY